MTDKLHALSATQLLRAYRSKELSPLEVAHSVLGRIDAWEPHIHATYALDRERVLAAAAQSQQRWLRGEPMGVLDGVPVTLKENIATRGVPIPLGAPIGELQPAPADAPPAARLREAGAVLLCKTTMPDRGMLAAGVSSFHGVTRNPWDLARNTGGSSSGAGAAAAAGYGPLHVGTDIGGSVRIPASFGGVFGFKPSFGRIPIDPPYPGRVAGPLSRTVQDSALLMNVLAQPDGRDYFSLPPQDIDWMALDDKPLAGLRLALWLDPGPGATHVHPEVRAAVEAAATAFIAQGAQVELLQGWVPAEMLTVIFRTSCMRVRMEMAGITREHRQTLLASVRAFGEMAAGFTADQVYEANVQSLALRSATVAATRGFDYVLSPVSAHPPTAAEAPTSETLQRDVAFTIAFSVSEQPAASINCGYTLDGLPIGLQIAGRRFDDLGVMRMARAWERMRPQQRPWPEPAVAGTAEAMDGVNAPRTIS